MKGDFSRFTGDPINEIRKHYAGVLHQQGRVWLDSDWNEEVLQRLELLRQTTRDIIGPSGAIVTYDDKGIAHGAFQITENRNKPADFYIGGGRYYVNGLLCELAERCTYTTQPDLPGVEAIAKPKPGEQLTALVYLEAWQRLVTAHEDDTLRESALGGPDTTARIQTVAQVKVKMLSDSVTDCSEAMSALPPPSDGKLTTSPTQPKRSDDLCNLSEPGNYTGSENHLYRVEIHTGGPVRDPQTDRNVKVAEFKWSRDNAAYAVRVKCDGKNRSTLTLESMSRDQATALRKGNWVEISSDISELRGCHDRDGNQTYGHLTTLSADPNPDLLTVSLQDPLPLDFDLDSCKWLLLRRWDGKDYAQTSINLGDGVEIEFSGSNLQPGDYWQFTTRSVDGSISKLDGADPMGIIRQRVPLAIVSWRGYLVLPKATVIKTLDEWVEADRNARGVVGRLKPQFESHTAAATYEIATVKAAACAAKATNEQLDQLERRLKIALEKLGETATVFHVIKDCRHEFAPLTKQACSVMVAPGESLCEAIAKVGEQGGVVCLLPGIHQLKDPVVVKNKSSLTLRGAGGLSTALITDHPTALQFENCESLTLTGLAVRSGTSSGKSKPDDFAANEKASEVEQGVIHFRDCQQVLVEGCYIYCIGFFGLKDRACIAFLGQETAKSVRLLDTTEKIKRFEEAFNRLPAVEQATRQSRAFSEFSAYGLVVRDCLLYADKRQHGLLIARAERVTATGNLIEKLVQAGSDPNLDNGDGFRFSYSDLLTACGNQFTGFFQHYIQANNCSYLTLQENYGNLGRRGFSFDTIRRLSLEDNIIYVAHGSPLELTKGRMQIIIRGNFFFADFLLPDDEQLFTYGVTVQGRNIVFAENQIECTFSPVIANVFLNASDGAVVAYSNYCWAPQKEEGFHPKQEALARPYQEQKKAIENLLAKPEEWTKWLEELRSQAEEDWPRPEDWANPETLPPSLKDSPPSLLVVGRTAITGLNVLSHGLVRNGLGSDQGTVQYAV